MSEAHSFSFHEFWEEVKFLERKKRTQREKKAIDTLSNAPYSRYLSTNFKVAGSVLNAQRLGMGFKTTRTEIEESFSINEGRTAGTVASFPRQKTAAEWHEYLDNDWQEIQGR